MKVRFPVGERIDLSVTSSDAGKRLDVYLGGIPAIGSRSAAARLIDEGAVLVDGASVARKTMVNEGMAITVDLPGPVESELRGIDIPLDIRYEDEYLIVLAKPAGLVVHPAERHTGETLVHALIAHAGIENLGSLQGEDRPGIVHRLDKDTSGLMLAAKTDDVQEALQTAIRLRAVDRRYLSLVQGYIAPETGLVDAPIGRDERDRTRMAVSDHPSARQAVTTFTVLERFEGTHIHDGFTLIECKLFTGRTHQIRVHMAYTGHPCVGDPVYGGGRFTSDLGLDRQFLHSHRLTFTHPVTGEELTFSDRLPHDLQSALDGIAELSMGRTGPGEQLLG